jgi:MSHA biogenesis protein MshM
VPAYLKHRLAIAAVGPQTDLDIFEPPAAQAIAHCSAGVPRLVNVLANKCLMLAYGENRHRVGEAQVRLAAKDTAGVEPAPSWWDRLVGGRFSPRPARGVAALSAKGADDRPKAGP